LFATKVEKMPGARKRSGDPVIARDRLIGKNQESSPRRRGETDKGNRRDRRHRA
jgi:hypothetical protein